MDLNNQRNILQKLIQGYRITQLIYIATKLNIADYLSSGPKSIVELAEKTKTEPSQLYKILRLLTTVEIFTEVDEKMFALSPLAEYLISNADNSLYDYALLSGNELYKAWGALNLVIQNEKSAFELANGLKYFDFIHSYQSTSESFNSSMSELTQSNIEEIIKNYDFSCSKKIIDVGGGTGCLLKSLLQNNPLAKGILYELDATIHDVQQKNLNTSFSAQCEFIAGDFLNSIPTGGDTYILKHILHNWPDHEARCILNNCRKSIIPGGKLLVIESISEYSNSDFIKWLDLNMCILFGAKERTLSEYDKLMIESNFLINRVIPTSSYFYIIECLPIIN